MINVAAGVLPEAHAFGHPGADGDDVLDDTAHFGADDVGIRVDAQRGSREDALQLGGDDLVVDGNDAGGGLAGEDLPGEIGPGEDGDGMPGHLVLGDLAHPFERRSFEALGEAHHRHPGPEERRRLGGHGAISMGWDRHDEDVGRGDGLVE